MTETNRIKALDEQGSALINHLESTTKTVLDTLIAINQNTPTSFDYPIYAIAKQLEEIQALKDWWKES